MQTFRDFEWVIVDDGSTDDTRETVMSWQKEADFPIRYFWQENGGKHRARNRGVREAKGELFFTLDDDDVWVPRCLEIMNEKWDQISAIERHKFAGIAGLCARKDGTIVGASFPEDIFDSDMFTIRSRYGIEGEKCGFQRTAVMREFPFPEIEGEKFVPEALVWSRIACKYRTRFINEVLRIFEPNPHGLTAAGVRLIVESPRGKALAFNELMMMGGPFLVRFRAAVNFARSLMHAGQSPISIISSSSKPILVLLGMPLAAFLYRRDRFRYLRLKAGR
jgi:glycosyltransferase involved in cell wall biosynthesis